MPYHWLTEARWGAVRGSTHLQARDLNLCSECGEGLQGNVTPCVAKDNSGFREGVGNVLKNEGQGTCKGV